VRLSVNGGPFDNVTTADLSGDARSFSFPVPLTPGTAVLRVAAKDSSGSQIAKGDSPPFTIVAPLPQPTTVTVTAPTGGTVQAGQQLLVTWTTTGPVSFHAVRLSVNGGPFDNVTTADLSGDARSFSFPVPSTPGTAVLRVAAKDSSGSQIAKGDSPPFTIVAPPPAAQLTVNSIGLNFVAQQGAISDSLPITIGSTGGPLSWTASSGVNWLLLVPSTGTTPSFATVRATAEQLGPSTYNTTLIFSAPGSNPVSVPVRFTVSSAPSSQLTVSSPSLSFVAQQGGTPVSQTISIGSTGGPLFWTATTGVPWLSIVPSAGTTPSSATVTATASSGFAPGTYTTTLAISAPGSAPVSVQVSLTVAPASAPPVVTGFQPARGQSFDIVTITGANFTPGATVRFGPFPSPDVFVVSPTTIRAAVPDGARPGLYQVVVATPQGTATSPGLFTILSSQ